MEVQGLLFFHYLFGFHDRSHSGPLAQKGLHRVEGLFEFLDILGSHPKWNGQEKDSRGENFTEHGSVFLEKDKGEGEQGGRAKTQGIGDEIPLVTGTVTCQGLADLGRDGHQ